MVNSSKDADQLVQVLKEWAMGPDWRAYATCYPLTGHGAMLNPDGWWPCPKPVRSRAGNPSISVSLGWEWGATVTCSPTGKNLTVLVPKGTKVIEVDT